MERSLTNFNKKGFNTQLQKLLATKGFIHSENDSL